MSATTPPTSAHVLLGLPSITLFPHDVVTVDVKRKDNARALTAMEGLDIRVLVGATRDAAGRDRNDIHPIGTLARLVSRTLLPDGAMRIVLQGLRRARIEAVKGLGQSLWAVAGTIEPTTVDEAASGRALATLQEHHEALAEADPEGSGELARVIPLYGVDVERISDLVATALPLAMGLRQELLIEVNATARLDKLNAHLVQQVLRVRAESSLEQRLGGQVRRNVLRDKIEVLRNELGEPGTHTREIERLHERLVALDVSDVVRDAFERAVHTLRRTPVGSPEAARLRSHLEWSLDLPWSRGARSPSTRSFKTVMSKLSESHVGLVDVKARIGEILAIRQLGGGARGTVLCFHGPPGTGKSSMARTVANALRRPLVTIPVGAMMHERELVGASARRDGSSPGAIMTGLHRSGVADPVILLDEIDKISLGGEGTAAGPLLQLLDPEHNAEFLDNYLGVPFDLSRCLFLATANDVDELPETLLDRMEFLPFHGYTESEKYAIGRRHLLPRAHEHAGILKSALKISPGALRQLIRGYTEEAGIRHLNRLLVSLARKAAVDVVHGGNGLDVKKSQLFDLLGARTVEEEIRVRRPAVGVATGLAWTSVGGALLPLEALAIPGSGRLTLTGQIGEVMRESVLTAVTYVRTCFERYALEHTLLDTLDLHLHFPAAATPKDGPSAGIAITSALVSLLTQRAARHDVAMTGEMSLLGAVFPVGGLREKLLAAIRCGIPEAIVPAGNAEDVLRLPPEVRDNIVIHLVRHVDEVIELALVQPRTRGHGSSTGSNGPRRVARRASGD